MEAKIDSAEKSALVEVVKLCQKRNLKGTKGNWTEFLNSYDRKFGSSKRDPSKRTHEDLAAFLNTFDNENDLKIFDKVLQCYSKRDILKQFKGVSSDGESAEEKLVRLTLEHPQYTMEYSFPYDEEWLVTKLHKKSKKKKLNAIIAIDCEMVLCEDGTEAVVRVCAVDRNLEIKLDKYVKPNKAIVDYRTSITGITAEDLISVTCSLADIQKSMEKILSHGMILAGHGLHNDLQALKIDHAPVIDTSLIYKYDGLINKRASLNSLCKHVLGYELRKCDAVHNCVDDARAAMKLVLAIIENGVNNTLTLVDNVSETEMSKLLLHRIATTVPYEELNRAITGNFKILVKPCMKKATPGDKYSAFAIFDNPEEADQAYENLEGRQEEDSCGRPQKSVTFCLSSGAFCSLYVRKMMQDHSLSQPSSRKRAVQVKETLVQCKKVKADKEFEAETIENTQEFSSRNLCEEQSKEIERLKQALRQSNRQCEDCLKEIEELKKELSQRDFAISNLHNLIDKLSRR